MRLDKKEIRQSLLEHLETKGLKPGQILVAKTGASLVVIDKSLEELEKDIESISVIESSIFNTGIAEGTILMFVTAHGIRRTDGSWDFWYQFLVDEQTFFVPSSYFGEWKLRNEFEVK